LGYPFYKYNTYKFRKYLGNGRPDDHLFLLSEWQKDELGGAQSATRQEKLLFQFDGDGKPKTKKRGFRLRLWPLF
jgi:hypothetical protein